MDNGRLGNIVRVSWGTIVKKRVEVREGSFEGFCEKIHIEKVAQRRIWHISHEQN